MAPNRCATRNRKLSSGGGRRRLATPRAPAKNKFGLLSLRFLWKTKALRDERAVRKRRRQSVLTVVCNSEKRVNVCNVGIGLSDSVRWYDLRLKRVHNLNVRLAQLYHLICSRMTKKSLPSLRNLLVQP